MAAPNRDVFINCPFDSDYLDFLHAIIFVIIRSGFRPRCALEVDDGSQNRFENICQIIGQCRYGVHDISRTEPGPRSRLPRFNMPLELGVFFGAKHFGGTAQKAKRCIVLDSSRFRYQRFISDISGQDIHAHRGKVNVLIRELAGWLRNESHDPTVPGGSRIAGEFSKFKRRLPEILADRFLKPEELTFGDYVEMVIPYLNATT